MEKVTTTAEQRARDLLDRLGMPDAQSLSSGDVIELANLIAENDRLKVQLELAREDADRPDR